MENQTTMKTNLTRNQLIALGTVGAVAVTGLSITAYNASVHEQVCLSYERQLNTEFDKGIAILQEVNGAVSMVSENPFAAFGLLGQMGELMGRANQFKATANNLKYAYVGTCGQDRFNHFVSTPNVKSKVDTISRLADSIHS